MEVTVNGYMPVELVASGEYMIGINFMGDQRMLQKQGFPVVSIVPEQTGLSVNAISKLKRAPNGIIADLFIDYCLSEEAGHILEKGFVWRANDVCEERERNRGDSRLEERTNIYQIVE